MPDTIVGVNPHPDEQPRRKCCSVCVFRPGDPQNISGRMGWEQFYFELDMGLLEFYCTHEPEEGRHRHCAGYWALYMEGRKDAPT